jgi:hypothetical protein
MGEKMRIGDWIKASVAVLLLSGASAPLRADPVTFTAQLTGVNPADIVLISDTTYHFDSLACYAGQLMWTSEGPSTVGPLSKGTLFGTYCVDIVHDIYIGGQYPYKLVTFASAPSLADGGGTYSYGTGTVSTYQAVENLWNDDYAASLTSNDASAAFQIDLWTILYQSTGFSASVWGGQSGWQTPAGTWLTNLNTELAGTHYYSVAGLDAMVATDPSNQGQDQALVDANLSSNASIVPAASSLWGGLALLGGCLAFRMTKTRGTGTPAGVVGCSI